jgi:AraC-like DNA-binding protein
VLVLQGLYAPTILYGRLHWLTAPGEEPIWLRPRHYHLFLVETGCHEITLRDDRRYRCPETGMYLIAPGGARIDAASGSHAIGVSFIVRAEPLEQVEGNLSLRQTSGRWQPGPEMVWGVSLPVLLDPTLVTRIRQDLRLIADRWWMDLERNLESHHRLAEVLRVIVVHARRSVPSTASAGGDLFGRAMEAIHADITSLRGVGDLAVRLGVSRRHLNRVFATTAEISPGRVLRRVRLAEAERLLREGGETLAGIATRLRFPSVAALAKCFQARFGLSPRRYCREKGCQVVPPRHPI